MRRFGLLVLVAADVLTLVTATPSGALPGRLAAPHAWISAAGVDAVSAELAAAGLWLAALWTAVGLACVAAARVPGGAGRAAARLARVILPSAVYRLAAGAAGAGVLLSPVVASAQSPVTVPAPAWPSSSTIPARHGRSARPTRHSGHDLQHIAGLTPRHRPRSSSSVPATRSGPSPRPTSPPLARLPPGSPPNGRAGSPPTGP